MKDLGKKLKTRPLASINRDAALKFGLPQLREKPEKTI